MKRLNGVVVKQETSISTLFLLFYLQERLNSQYGPFLSNTMQSSRQSGENALHDVIAILVMVDSGDRCINYRK